MAALAEAVWVLIYCGALDDDPLIDLAFAQIKGVVEYRRVSEELRVQKVHQLGAGVRVRWGLVGPGLRGVN